MENIGVTRITQLHICLINQMKSPYVDIRVFKPRGGGV